MQTSRFQLGLLCALSLALGAALTSSDAIGYPSGSAISYQYNPVVSIGGTAYSSEAAKSLLTAPADQALVITDVVLTSTSNIHCKRTHKTELSTTSGAILGQYETASSAANSDYYNNWSTGVAGRNVEHAYQSGLRLNAGETLFMGVTQTGSHILGSTSGCTVTGEHGVRYSISGYYAQP